MLKMVLITLVNLFLFELRLYPKFTLDAAKVIQHVMEAFCDKSKHIIVFLGNFRLRLQLLKLINTQMSLCFCHKIVSINEVAASNVVWFTPCHMRKLNFA